MKPADYLDGKDFSIVLGGPFYQFLRKMHLTGDALELLKQRMIILSLATWMPLLLLSLMEGQAWGDSLTLPFLKDIDAHLRFLVALPLLVLAEMVVHQRMAAVVKQFRERNLIPESATSQFNSAIESALKLRNSVFAEILMVVVIYLIGYKLVWQQTVALDSSAWYADADGKLSFAGSYFRYFSLPIFQFLFIRWYYRIFIWTRFLFQVSRIRLNLVPMHPDNVGGLGFLSGTIHAFLPLAFAHGTLASAMIATNIFSQGAKLLDFKFEILIIVFFVILLVTLPLFLFAPQLSETKRIGSIEFGKLASQFVEGFRDRWMKPHTTFDNTQIGGDIQSLSDLSNSYNVVENMKVLPLNRNAFLMLAIATIAPIAPLALTMMPLGELVKMLARILL